MNLVLLSTRIIHVGLGTFWAGAMIFNALFLFPAIRDAGPDGAKVAGGLMRRNFMVVVPIVAILTLLSGFYLLSMAAGLTPGYMGTRIGMVYSTGMLASLVAFAVGIGIVRPSMIKAITLSQSVGSAAPAERDRILGEIQRLRAKAGIGGQIVAYLLGLAVVTMAVARYI